MRDLLVVTQRMADEELLDGARTLVARERRLTAELIAHLAEIDSRGLALRAGHPSLFAYCREVLGLSEYEAYSRIEAARAARRFPLILELLHDNAITMTAATLLARHLTAENHERVLRAACGRSRSQVEEMVVALAPRPTLPATVRPLPPSVAPPVSVPAPRPAPLPQPLAPQAFRYQLTIDAETRDLLSRAKELSAGDDASLLRKALALLVADLEVKKSAATERPQPPRATAPDSRHMPAHVKRAVWSRDAGQCAYRAPDGRRCLSRHRLEYHHAKPYAAGGAATVENIQLRCRAHNQYEAQVFFAVGRQAQLGLERVPAP